MDVRPGRYVRVYEWNTPGITYSYKQTVPSSLTYIDHSQRITGGGIVFHSPGDIVFSIVSFLSDPLFSGKLKDKFAGLASHFKHVLGEMGFHAFDSNQSLPFNFDYCQTYHNPYELSINNEKVVAFSLRKRKDRIIIQGIVHVSSGLKWFSDIPNAFHGFLSGGLDYKEGDLSKKIQTRLIETLIDKV